MPPEKRFVMRRLVLHRGAEQHSKRGGKSATHLVSAAGQTGQSRSLLSTIEGFFVQKRFDTLLSVFIF